MSPQWWSFESTASKLRCYLVIYIFLRVREKISDLASEMTVYVVSEKRWESWDARFSQMEQSNNKTLANSLLGQWVILDT